MEGVTSKDIDEIVDSISIATHIPVDIVMRLPLEALVRIVESIERDAKGEIIQKSDYPNYFNDPEICPHKFDYVNTKDGKFANGEPSKLITRRCVRCGTYDRYYVV